MRKTILICLFLVLITLLALPASAYDGSLPRVIDKTSSLTSSEVDDLNERSEEFRLDFSMDCVVLLVDTLEGKSARAFADDAYDEGGYGMGADNSGILLLISLGDREVYISTCGSAIASIDDYEIERILDDMMSALGDEDWHRAFADGISSAGRMIQRPNGQYTNGGETDSDTFGTGERLLVTFLVPALIAAVVVGVMCCMMNNARGKFAAADYAVKGSFNLTGVLDIFLSRHVSKTPRASENSGGGGSSHLSSSGVSHGGGGRSF